jgi:hypothetical protein
MNKIIVNTTNEKELYAFFMPLTTMIWNKIIGYSPISIFIGSEDTWNQPKNKFIKEETQKYGRIIRIEPVAGMESSTMAQVSRLYASALADLPESDYLLTGDVDMFPLDKKRYHSQDFSQLFHVFNSDAYEGEEDRYPMCYLGGTVKVWRQIMKIKQLDIREAVEDGIVTNPIEQPWNHDELSFYKHLSQSDIKYQKLPRVHTGYNFGRLDRGGWKQLNNLNGMVDAHLLRPGSDHWGSIFHVIKLLCQKPEIEFANNYYKQYMKLRA